MSCRSTFIYEAALYLLFLLECRTGCERNIGTSYIFVSFKPFEFTFNK